MQSYSSPYNGTFGLNTGDKVWDQNLSSLGGLLFPDQSKVAQAYHFGSEARKAQLESNKLIDQQNYRNEYGMLTHGQQPGPLTFRDPGNVPGAAPIRDAPTNLPYTGAAPAAAPAVANLAAMATNMTPQQGASLAETVIPQFTTGRAAQLSGPPAPGLPSAPQTTGSDGSVPNDEGVLHPASINTTGGGQQQASPAQHNGSPGQMPPGMTLPGIMALAGAGSLGGLDAASVGQGLSALAYEMYSRGIIGRDQYHQMLGATGSPSLATTDVTAAAAIKGHQIAAAAELAKQRMVTGESARQFNVTPVPAYNDQEQPVYVPRKDVAGRRVVIEPVETARATAAAAPGQYLTPGGQVQTKTAGTAIQEGLPAAATSAEQQSAQTIQRINAMPEGPEKQQAIQNWRALQTLPKEIKPEDQRVQQVADYEQTQRIYSVPQKGYASPAIKDNSAFDNAADTAIDQRAHELSTRPEGRRLLENPVKARAAAINDLMKNPTKDGLRLPTPAEVAKQREGSLAKRAEQGIYGDQRLDDFYNPLTAKSGAHMMIRLVPKDYKPGGEPGAAAAATSAAPATAGAAAAPVAAAPPAAPYVPPGSGLIERIGSIFRGNTPPYQSPRSGQAAAPQATAAPAVPAGPAPTVSGGAPPGALGPARPGVPDGPATTADGRVVVVRGGWVYPQQ